jgi:hypothetical protein
MFSWRRQQSASDSSSLRWNDEAKKALEQALVQMPVPAMLKGQVRKELETAAENYARGAGRSEVTAQDLMEGMLAKMPPEMRAKVEEAMKQGPAGLKKLQDELK